MNHIENDISKLQSMKSDLYQIISNISAMNEVCKAYDNNNKIYLWKGEFYEVTEYGVDEHCDLKLYVLAKTEEEAEIRLKAKADEEYYEYEFYITKIEEDENGIMDEDDII